MDHLSLGHLLEDTYSFLNADDIVAIIYAQTSLMMKRKLPFAIVVIV